MKVIQSKCKPRGPFRAQSKPVTITKIIDENADIKSFIFDASLKHGKPGQFVMVWLPGIKEAPFCIAHSNPFKITVFKRGPLTQAMHNLKIGDKVWIRGPYGINFKIYEKHTTPLLVGGGYGAAPLAFFAEKLIKKNTLPLVILGGRTKENIIGIDDFKRLNITPLYTTNDGSRGIKGLVTKPIKKLLNEKNISIIYGIGPNAMLDALLELSTQYNVPAELSYEAEMRCGIGLCGMCECKGKLLCVEGPVLRFNF